MATRENFDGCVSARRNNFVANPIFQLPVAPQPAELEPTAGKRTKSKSKNNN